MITYQEGAKCILKHCHDLHDESVGCKRGFVRSTVLSPQTTGVTRIFSRTNGPAHESFECSNEIGECSCMHSEPKVLLDITTIIPGQLQDGNIHFQYILLCSFSPCIQCTNIIINSAVITAVIYDKMYRDERGEERLRKVMPVLTVRQIEDIAGGSYRGELNFIKRWGG